MKRKFLSLFLALFLFLAAVVSAFAAQPEALNRIYDPFATALPASGSPGISVDVPFAILMDRHTGTVIFEQEADVQTQPASITKIMTILLTLEEIEAGRLSLTDMINTSAYAASMGGSQIFLEEGEQMTAEDMLKSVIISSANDASVALAEHIAGTEEAFVARMNERASALGMTNTVFINSTGLPGEGIDNLTTARDVAIMSRALLAHDLVKEFSTIWMDTVRNGEFGLTNTNRLVYYFDGATGLKTGFTQEAMYCLAASAMRDGVEFIAVVLHGQTSDTRFEAAKTLLNYAFANYTLLELQPDEVLPPMLVSLGTVDSVQPILQGDDQILISKTATATIRQEISLVEELSAPVTQGQVLGSLSVFDGDNLIATVPIVAADEVEKISILGAFGKFLSLLFHGGL